MILISEEEDIKDLNLLLIAYLMGEPPEESARKFRKYLDFITRDEVKNGNRKNRKTIR